LLDQGDGNRSEKQAGYCLLAANCPSLYSLGILSDPPKQELKFRNHHTDVAVMMTPTALVLPRCPSKYISGTRRMRHPGSWNSWSATHELQSGNFLLSCYRA
jgi:hypothetical protein